jgi:hypothetical protein
MQLSIAAISAEMHDVRGRAALACAIHCARGRKRASWLAEATRCAGLLRRNPVPAAQPFAAALAAGIAFAEGGTEVGSGELERARVGFERAAMSLHASVCSLWLASHSRGARAAELAVAGESMLRSQHVDQPHRLASVLLPGYARELSTSPSH